MTACDDNRIELGAYALGALEPDENERIEAHLEECERCRAELEELSSASDLLRSPATRAFAAVSEPELDGTQVERALARVAATRTRELRRVQRLRQGLAAAGVGLVASAGIAIALASRTTDSFAPTGQAITLQAAPRITAAASVRLSSRPWGTQIDFRSSHLPPLPAGGYYEVWVVRQDGTRIAAGTFRPTSPDGHALVRLAAAIPRQLVAHIGITRQAAGDSTRILETPV